MEDILRELRDFNRRIRLGYELTDEERERYSQLYDCALEFIEKIDNDYAVMCLSERYINRKKWPEIAEGLGQYSVVAVRKYASRAVKKSS